MASPKYQKLPGSGSRNRGFAVVACRNTLWMGDDHLLSVDRTFFAETYKRFYFRDIQALILQRTWRRGKWNIFFSVMLMFFMLVQAYSSFRGPDLPVFSSTMVVVSLIFLLVNTLRGPTCRLRLRTAVQEEELAACQRLGTARRAMARIVARVTEVQKRPSREEIAALAAAAAPPRPAAAAPPSEELPPPAIEAAPPPGEPAAAPGAEA